MPRSGFVHGPIRENFKRGWRAGQLKTYNQEWYLTLAIHQEAIDFHYLFAKRIILEEKHTIRLQCVKAVLSSKQLTGYAHGNRSQQAFTF